MRVAKWGNSLAVRLPTALADKLSVKLGDNLEAKVTGARSFQLTRPETEEEFMAAMRALSRPMPADYKFDREEANSRGED